MQAINADLKYKFTRLWSKNSKWSIDVTGYDLVNNAHSNNSNLSYGVTGRCYVKIRWPKTKDNKDIIYDF